MKTTKVLQGKRVILILAITAVVFLALGVLVSRLVVSPGEAAAKTAPPTEGLISVPVENKKLSNNVVTRASVQYDEGTEVYLDSSTLSGSAVVTGRVLETGSQIDGGSIILEVAGRPVIALPGDLPMYRSLSIGVSGPDVKQLKQALNSIGINPGNLDSDTYDEALANAVGQLYKNVGYSAPESDANAKDNVKAANQMVESSKQEVASAQKALNERKQGPSQVELIEAQNAVNQALLDLNTAEPQDQQTARGAYDLAVAQQKQLLQAPDTSAEQNMLAEAQRGLKQAQEDLAQAEAATKPSLPVSEVVFFSNLPRRVDQVNIARSQTVSNQPFMRVSGADVVIEGSVSQVDASLLSVGMEGSFKLPDGSEITTPILEINTGENSSDKPSGDSENKDDSGTTETKTRQSVKFSLETLTTQQLQSVMGSSLRITIPINSTDDKVLAVPAAALTVGPGGESRVEKLVSGDKTEIIEVTPGMAASGFVELKDVGDKLTLKDRVVVGNK